METIQMITEPTPSIKRMENLAIEIRDLINKFQEKEDTYNDSQVITSVLKVVAPFIIKYNNENSSEDLDEFFYLNILNNYLEMATEGVENYWGDENGNNSNDK